MDDVLGEAKALQHLGLGSAEAADEAMARAMGTVERALTPNHPVIAEILLSRARLQSQAHNYPKVLLRFTSAWPGRQRQHKIFACLAWSEKCDISAWPI